MIVVGKKLREKTYKKLKVKNQINRLIRIYTPQ